MRVPSASTWQARGELLLQEWRLYVADRFSDGNIRYFELENDKFEYLAEYKSGDPQRGLAFMPKRGVNMHQNEVVRIFKSVADTYVEPISFIVPRRSEVFQDDIYPPTIGLKPAMSSAEWHEGKEAIPPKISMESLYEGSGEKEVTPTQNKPTATISAPAPKAAEPIKEAELAPEPEPTPIVRPAPSMKEQGASMAAMVNKFADDDDKEEAVDDTSSFEEVSKPSERSAASPVKAATPIEMEPPMNNAKDTTPVASTPVTAAPVATESSTAPANDVSGYIQEIKDLLAQQTKIIAAQAEQVQHLTTEIESLKAKLS
jgi:coronin-1B/1C/6